MLTVIPWQNRICSKESQKQIDSILTLKSISNN
jgi:hypothetical protein